MQEEGEGAVARGCRGPAVQETIYRGRGPGTPFSSGERWVGGCSSGRASTVLCSLPGGKQTPRGLPRESEAAGLPEMGPGTRQETVGQETRGKRDISSNVTHLPPD